jgi:hypothetical protein
MSIVGHTISRITCLTLLALAVVCASATKLGAENVVPPYNPAGAGQITLSQGQLFRDGQPWHAKGVVLIARLAPPKLRSRSSQEAQQAAAAFSPETLLAVQRFGADTVRFAVSQGALGLAPRSGAGPAHRSPVGNHLFAVSAARSGAQDARIPADRERRRPRYSRAACTKTSD